MSHNTVKHELSQCMPIHVHPMRASPGRTDVVTNQTDDRTNPIIVQHAQSHHGAYILQDALHPRLASV
jgi:hypothetical protein